MSSAPDFPSEDDILVLPETYTYDVDRSLPLYTATDESSLETRIANSTDLGLPVLRLASRGERLAADITQLDKYSLHDDIVISFFHAIQENQDDVVAQFIARGLVSPDVTNGHMETPLLAAIRSGNTGMLRRLLSLGALVNGYGHGMDPAKPSLWVQWHRCQRTPLQYAAAVGNLAMVKVLMEEFGADDSLVAEDGQIALRLAAENGHREVVAYLPARRAGAWKRWKTRHEKEMRRVRAALDNLYRFGRFFVVTVPKTLLWDLPRYVWRKRARIARWMKRQVVELPRRVAKLGRGVAKGIRKLPEYAVKLVKKLWIFLCKIPPTLKIFANWLVDGMKRVADALLEVLKKTMSVVHTAVMTVITWFKEITLQDVINGLKAALQAVFVDLPLAVWKFVDAAGEVLYKAATALLGGLGQALWVLGYCLWHVVIFVPEHLWDMCKAVAASVGAAFNEIMLQFNPKRVA